MTIGIIGLTVTSLDFAKRSADAGYELAIANTHTAFCTHDLKNIIPGNVEFVNKTEAARADIILLFSTKEALESVITTLPDMTGKIILLTNNFITDDGITYPLTSINSHTIISSLLPGAHIIKIYNMVSYSKIIPYNFPSPRTKIYFSGSKHIKIKKVVEDFLQNIGFVVAYI